MKRGHLYQHVTQGTELPHQEVGEWLYVVKDPLSSGQAEPKWMQDLATQTIPVLKQTQHYASAESGFVGGDTTKPFTLVNWQAEAAGRSSLERRWIQNKLVRKLETQWPISKVAAYVHGYSGLAIAMLDDIYFNFANTQPWQEPTKAVRVIGVAGHTYTAEAIRHEENCRAIDWINANGDDLTSLTMAQELGSFAKQYGCEFKLLELEDLQREKMNLLLAVGQASDRSPSRLIVLTHNCNGREARPLTLVGKGITFDTGGINVKAYENFVSMMKNDMGGAAVAAALFRALVRSNYSKPLALVIPACENLIDSRAMKPGCVVKSRAGKTVTIEHTDAEGRLILADALDYARTELEPRQVLSFATLTTASLRQHGPYWTPVHFAQTQQQAILQRAAHSWGEELMFWPEFIPFFESNKGRISDLTNMGRLPSHANIGCGSNVAAHFLREFVPGPYMHFDIFNSIWNWSDEYPGPRHGATGAVFNPLLAALSEL